MILDRMPGREGMVDPCDISGYNKSNQGGVTPTLIEKTVTENKTYNASDDGADGYSSVTVNVAAPTPETFEVEMVLTGTSEVTVTTSKTLSETLSALSSGKNVSLSVDINGNAYVSICCGAYEQEGMTAIYAFIYLPESAAPAYLLGWAGDSGTAIQVEPTATLLIPPQT